MNILDAVKTGKKIRRSLWKGDTFYTYEELVWFQEDLDCFTKDSFLAEDWEVEQTKIVDQHDQEIRDGSANNFNNIFLDLNKQDETNTGLRIFAASLISALCCYAIIFAIGMLFL